ncbi:DNA-binding protein [Candidatus Francisella endociliophora]|uniref:DNA-binding protein n=1 Tax=Candidatus Francisella endociliophora TaxID=653937 RepID=A0A097EP63_9GAMM|nr:DNA-processing protein DprA [Francisella sp. FSC1006]AIT09353.1 DNA-binding protein [Francisella sp. FSC1006]
MLTNTKSSIILSHTPYFGNSRFSTAINNGIELEEIIQFPDKHIKTLKLRKETISFLKEEKYSQYLEKANRWINKPQNHIVTILDKNYPKNLRELPDAPFIIYCSGNLTLLDSPQLAIVGARNYSTYGKNVTDKICHDLSKSKITVTSGLAYGIDTLAHKFALDNNLNTIAVVGTGADIVYPSSNRDLYSRILQNSGLIVSEFPLGTGPLRHNFPQRNRIISGLAKGVIVVEAAHKSGSLITAQLALEQNKEVFAIPGSIFSKTSEGCNDLIKQGAKLVSNINDILEEINIDYHSNPSAIQENNKKSQIAHLSLQEQSILQIVASNLTTLDKIIIESKLPYNQVTEILFELEMKSLIESVPGGYINTQKFN